MPTNTPPTLFTPGPVTVPQRVLAAGSLPMIHHRTPLFHAVYSTCIRDMQWLLGTKQDVLLTHTTGRGAMESSITNLLCPGDSVAAVVNGNFGAMYAKIARAYGLNVHEVLADWEKPFADGEAAQELEAVLLRHPGIKAVTICHNDTSNGVENDIRLAARMAHAHGAMLFVDAVSSVGCAPIEFDAWDLDFLATSSQKGLMSPAGAAFAVLSERAWKATEGPTFPHYFTDFKSIRKIFWEKPDAPETPGSTPVSLVRSVAEALTMLREEGREQVFARHARLASALRAGLDALGLTLVPANSKSPSVSVSAFFSPEGVQPAAVRKVLLESFNIQIAGGLGQYKENTLRIGHMGYVRDADIVCVIGALEAALCSLGAHSASGAGVAAVLRNLQSPARQ